jgi:hypothetical protein
MLIPAMYLDIGATISVCLSFLMLPVTQLGINPLQAATSITPIPPPARLAFIAAIRSGNVTAEGSAPSSGYGDYSSDAVDRLPSPVQMAANRTLLPLIPSSKRTPG